MQPPTDAQATAFLEAFVRIRSLSFHEHEAAAFLVAAMRDLGMAAHIDGAGNAVGTIGEHGPQVVLLGHIDTVGGDVPVALRDGKLYGRGSVDAKGAFATFVQAAARAHAAGTLACQVVLVGAVEEEAATSKGAHYIVDRYQPAYCVIGEPSGWQRVTLGYKGRLLVHYTRRQPAAHSAGELAAAPEHLVAFWQRIAAYAADYNAPQSRLFAQLTPSLRRVVSDSDGLYDTVHATIGLRLPEAIAPMSLQETIIALLPRSDDDPGTTALRFEGACPAFRSERTTPLAAAFNRAIRVAGGQTGYLHKTGTADMNVVGPAWQCPIVAYGPGDSRLDHTPDEHLDLAEYHRAIAILGDVLGRLR